jgi:6-phosphogluconolactonase
MATAAAAPAPVAALKSSLRTFDTEEDVAISLAKYTAELSEKFAAERGAFTVVLSGGTLIETLRFVPRAPPWVGWFRSRFFDPLAISRFLLASHRRKLAEPPYLETVDWSKWHVFWVDERVVRKDHVDSNYKLAVDGLLSKVFPTSCSWIYSSSCNCRFYL